MARNKSNSLIISARWYKRRSHFKCSRDCIILTQQFERSPSSTVQSDIYESNLDSNMLGRIYDF